MYKYNKARVAWEMNGKVNDTENMKPRKKVECACEEFDIGLGILHLILKFFETFLNERAQLLSLFE